MIRFLFTIILILSIIIVMYGSLALYYLQNLKKDYRYLHKNHLFFLIVIIMSSAILYMVLNIINILNQIFSKELIKIFPPSFMLGLILIIYLFFKILYKRYIEKKDKIKVKLPKPYYKKDNKIYIQEKYLYLIKVFKFTSFSIIILLSLGIGFLYYIKIIKLKSIFIIIEAFMILTLFLLEISIYLDGNYEEALSTTNKNNKVKKILTKKEILFANINKEYQRLWSKQILGRYKVENDYKIELINTEDNENIFLADSEENKFSNFIYSKVFNPIINGEDMIIENCLLENFSTIMVPMINIMFATNKKMLFIVDSIEMIHYLEKWLEELELKNDISNSNLVVEVLNYKDNSSIKNDHNIDIYLGTVDLILNSRAINEQIDVIFGLNIDKILATSSLQLNLLTSVLSNNHQDTQYILFSSRINGLKQVISQVFMRSNFQYQIIEKTYKNNLTTNFFSTEKGSLQTNILPNFTNQYLGQLLPIAIPGIKYGIEKVNVISEKALISDQKQVFQASISLLSEYLDKDIINLDETIQFSFNENFLKLNNPSVVVIEDTKYNPALITLDWLKYSKTDTILNIVSMPYLLRDYIIDNIDFFIANAEIFANILPIPKSNIKLVVYKLINQLCYGYIAEDILLREIQKQKLDISIDMFASDQVCFITKALEELTKQAFCISICYSSYLISKKVTEDHNLEAKCYYKLLEIVKKELPKKYFQDITFLNSEQSVKILKKIPIYELYQNYLEGQYHSFLGKYYLIDKIDDNNGIVELVPSSNHSNIRYRMCRYISNMILKNTVKEMPISKIRDSILKKKIISAEFTVHTDGYYEFKDNISFVKGEYSYKKVTTNQRNLCRKYKAHDILTINISSGMINKLSNKEKDKLSFTLSVLLNELFLTLFSEINQYILVRNVIKDNQFLNDYANEELVNLYKPIIDNNITDGINLYIMEDTELEKGVVDAIINSFDNVILKILYDYLDWLLNNDNINSNKEYQNDNKTFIKSSINDKLAFLKYGQDKLSGCLDLKNTYKCLHDLILKGNDNLTINRVEYLKRRQEVKIKEETKKNEEKSLSDTKIKEEVKTKDTSKKSDEKTFSDKKAKKEVKTQLNEQTLEVKKVSTKPKENKKTSTKSLETKDENIKSSEVKEASTELLETKKVSTKPKENITASTKLLETKNDSIEAIQTKKKKKIKEKTISK